MKIYTKSGDKGETSLFDGSRVSKSDARIDLLGELDELNARIGVLVSSINSAKLVDFSELEFLQKLQSLILDLGAEIANPKLDSSKFKDFSEYVLEMESKMDEMDKNLDELKNFILPGGSLSAANAHLCRTQARKTERELISLLSSVYSLQSEGVVPFDGAKKFLNRMSDYFFVLARFLNKVEGVEDIVWK